MNSQQLNTLAGEILAKAASAENKDSESRYLVGIAGAPASGKSTLTEKLAHYINNQAGSEVCTVVPMDGFHKDNIELDQLNLRHRKGAPETFDVTDFIVLIQRLKTASSLIKAPTFDREIDAVVPDSQTIEVSHKILLIEGNYLLLDEGEWRSISPLLDCSIFISSTVETLTKRLIERWLHYGYSPEQAEKKALENDIPNAKRVVENSQKADITI